MTSEMSVFKRRISRINRFVLLAAMVAAAQLIFAAAWAQPQPAWKFAVLCDTRGDNNLDRLEPSWVNESVVGLIAGEIVRDGAEMVIVPGDLVSGGRRTQTPYAAQFAAWRKAMAPVYDSGIKVYPVRGNHEDDPFLVFGKNSLKTAYLEAFSDPWIPSDGPAGEEKLTYGFVHRNAFFVGLDQFITPLRVNQAWLDEQLKNNKEPHVFVYGHAPAFSIRHSDSLASHPKERDDFWNSLGNAGVRIYFAGHDHFYNRARAEDRAGNTIHQVVVGSGGAPLSKWKSRSYAEGDRIVNDYHNETHYGYGLVTVDGPRVVMEWKALFNEDGKNVWKTMDSFHYTVE